MTGTIDSLVHHIYVKTLLETGRMATASGVAEALSVERAAVVASLREMESTHGVVLHPHVDEVWVIHPFSGSPTATWVDGGAVGWWAPCMWCACGVAALAGRDVVIHARIGGETVPVQVAVRNGRIEGADLRVHFPTPPRDAWNNVHHFCATVLPFESAAQVEGWSERHGLPKGAVVPLAQVMELARAWYGRHADRDWVKWTVQEAGEIFARVGLTGPFWKLQGEGKF